MTNFRTATFSIVFSAIFIAPVAALAHDGKHAEDPNLHDDPAVKDCEVHFAANLTQDAFRRFAREFGSVSAFKQGASANTLGKGRVAVGLEYMSFAVDEHSAAWNDTFVHPDKTHELGSRLAFPKLEARVGVADDTDVGVYFAKNIQSNYGWLGFDVKHALLRQGLDVPVTVSLRGAYTKTLFIHDMDMHALSAGVTAAHTLWNTVTPYAGVGTDVVFARERSSAVDLHSELVVTPNALAGIEVAVWRVAIGFEAQVGPVATAQARTTFVF